MTIRSNHHIHLNSDDVIIQKLEQLHKSFTDLASRIRERIDELIESGRYSLRKLAIRIEEAQIYRVRGLTDVKTTDEFFELVRPHYNFLDCRLLETLADKFLYKEDLQSIQQHKRNVFEFKKNSQVKRLKSNVEDLKATSDHHEPVVIKVQDAWEEEPLILMEVLINNLFRHHGHEVNWFKVVPGSVCLMFVAHKEVCQSLITSSDQKLEFMRLMGVFSLQIGSEYVLQEDENKSYTFEFALLNAAKVGNNEAVRFLLYMGVNVNHRDTEGKTALMLASEAGHKEVVQTLLSCGANINLQDNTGETALMIACEKESLAIIRRLLSAKADPNLQCVDGSTAMHTACYIGRRDIVKLLIKSRANFAIPSSKGETAFILSVKRNNFAVAADLVSLMPSTHIQLGVIAASRLGYLPLFSLLLSHLHISSQMVNLFLACANGNATSVLEQCMEFGINPNSTLVSDVTPLMIASSCGHFEVMKVLIKLDADVNSKDKDGYTPLAYAITGRKALPVIQHLLEAQANPNVLLGDLSLAEKAKEEGATEEVVNLILKHSALHLHRNFTHITGEVEKCIGHHIQEKKDSIFQVAKKIEEILHHVTELTTAQNIRNLFDKLKPYYSFLSCNLLIAIVKTFGEREIQSELDKYLIIVAKFKSSVTIKNLREVLSFILKLKDTPDTLVIFIKLNGEWEEGTLEHLQQLLEHLFHDKQHLLNHIAVDERDLLCIMFTIPRSQLDSIVDEVRKSIEFMGFTGVSGVFVGDVNIVSNARFSFSSGLLRAAEKGIIKAVQLLLDLGVNINNGDSEGRTALMLASKAGHEDIVQTLLSFQASVNRQDNVGRTALTFATETQHEGVIQVLLSAGAIDYQDHTVMAKTDSMASLEVLHTDIATPTTRQGSTILMGESKKDQNEVLETQKDNINSNIRDNEASITLMSASENGHLAMVKKLLKGGADVNMQTNGGETALMLASKNGHSGVVKILLKEGADPNLSNKDGLTALMFACANSHLEVVEILLKRHANPNFQIMDGRTALMIAIDHSHLEVVKTLLKRGADPNFPKENEWTALMRASLKGQPKVVNVLIKKHADPNIKLNNGRTALMIASDYGHSEVVELLLKKGADPDVWEKTGQTALMCATKNNHTEVAEILLRRGADPNYRKIDGRTALIIASEIGHSEVVKVLLKRRANINFKTMDGRTPLMIAVDHGHSEVVEILLNGGADPNIQEENGWTALMHASLKGHPKVVNMLLEQHADPNIKFNSGGTALMIASDYGHSEVVELLLKRGADPNFWERTGWTALMFASKNNHTGVAEILLKECADPNIRKVDRATALMIASENGHSDVVQVLLEGEADPNIQKEGGWTALMIASRNNYSEVVRILLKEGADPNIQEDGWTALRLAHQNGHSDVVKILLESGADHNITTKKGNNALL